MEVAVDRAVCEAHGRCVDIAPDVFELDEDEVLQVRRPHPPEDDLVRMRLAVRSCPKQALRLSDDRR